MRTVCRPGGSPATENAPALSLTPNARAPRTATITPGMGRPFVDDRAVPPIRAVVSRATCARNRGAAAHSMSRVLSAPAFTTRNLSRGSRERGARRRLDVRLDQPHLLLCHVAADPDHSVTAHDRVHR